MTTLELFVDASKRKPFVNTDRIISQLGIRGIESLIAELEATTNAAMLAGDVVPINVEQGVDYILLNDTARHEIAKKYESSFEAITFCFGNRYYKQSKIIELLRPKIQGRKNAALKKKNKTIVESTVTPNMAAKKWMPFEEANKAQIVEMLKKDIDMSNTCIKTPTCMYFIDPGTNQMISIPNDLYLAAYAEVNSIDEANIGNTRQPRKTKKLEIVL